MTATGPPSGCGSTSRSSRFASLVQPGGPVELVPGGRVVPLREIIKSRLIGRSPAARMTASKEKRHA